MQTNESLKLIERVYWDSPALQRYVNKLRSDPVSLERSEAAILQYRKGNKNRGKSIKKTKGLRDIYHISLRNKARVYFRNNNSVFQVVDLSGKDD